MVDNNSSLVKENLIPVGVPGRDGFDQPFEGKSGKIGYEITCEGDPTNQDDFPKFTNRPGEITGANPGTNPGTNTGGGTKPPAPAGPGK